MGTTISCIIPVYNGARFLGEALDSILAQTLPPTEIIVVDDGSTDATAEVAAAYAPRVSVVRQANAGPASARNRGIDLATGELISFLDADDLWHKEKLARQLQALTADASAGFCITYLQNFWVEELAEEREQLRDHTFAKPLPGYVCQCLLAHRSVFDTVGRFDESKRLGEDTEWFRRADRAGVVKQILTDVLVHRRIHVESITFEIYRSQKMRTHLMDNVIENLKYRRARAAK